MQRNQGILRVGLLFLWGWLGFMAVDNLAAQPAETDAERFYKQGLISESLADRISHFRQAIDRDPDFQAARYQLGIALYQKGEFSEAIRFLSRLDTTSFEDVPLYLRNAYTFYAAELNDNEEFARALAFARKALDLDADYPPALRELGKSYCAQEIWQPCLEALTESVTLDANQELVWNQLGDLYLRENAYQKAVEAYERALSLNSDLKAARFHLKIAQQRQTPDLYLSRYEKAIQSGNFDEGISILRQARDLFPESDSITEKLQAAIQARDYQSALDAVDKKDWERAFDLLRDIDPEYRDTALKLEEVRAELLLSSNDSLVALAPEGAQLVGSATIPQESGLSNGEEDTSSTNSNELLGETQSDTTAADSGETIARVTLFDGHASLLDNRVEGVAERQKSAFGFLNPWLWGGLGGMLVLAFFALRFLKGRTVHKSAPGSGEMNTNEFFQENLSSVTPVTFDPLDTGQIVSNNNKKLLSDTRTIASGVRKVQRIGRYVIEQEIGRGSMGLIFKAWDPMLDRIVVIKQMLFDINAPAAEIKKLRDRLYREARAAGRLNHPNIVIIYDVEEDRNISYIVMEYVEGRNLQTLLTQNGTFTLARSVKLATQICDALAFAHENDIVHRDIKPSNILLNSSDRVKVADFGIAKLLHFGTLTQTGNIVGTPFYMSPEQIEGRALDGRSDIFSLGVLLYEMLTGIRPFQGENLPTVVYKIIHKVPPPPSLENESLPAQIDEIVERALAKDPSDRYATVKDLRRDLVKLQTKSSTTE